MSPEKILLRHVWRVVFFSRNVLTFQSPYALMTALLFIFYCFPTRRASVCNLTRRVVFFGQRKFWLNPSFLWKERFFGKQAGAFKQDPEAIILEVSEAIGASLNEFHLR